MEWPSLSEQPISKEQEKKLRKLAKELFLNDYPNPERNGCPDSQTIRAIAFGKITGEEADRWRVHAATCSPCTRGYVSFRKEAVRAKRVRTLGLIAAAIILIAIVGWATYSKFGPGSQGVRLVAWAEGWRPASLDLRGHEALRGGEPGPAQPPLVLPRGKLVLSIDLPVGSEPGKYDVELQQPSGQTVARTIGTADLVNGLTVLKLRIDTRRAGHGPASLFVCRSGATWAAYAVMLN